jgi:hypothetical protein
MLNKAKFPTSMYTVKKSFSIFPSPTGMSPTKLSLGVNYYVIYKLFLPRESLVSEIPVGDGNIEKLFFTVYRTALLIRMRNYHFLEQQC